ncbi:hypothetical protein D3C71_1819180 [compost metagenome]
MRQATETNRFLCLLQYDGKEPPSIFSYHPVELVQERVGFLVASPERKKLHDLRIGVDFTEKVAIGFDPGAQDQTGRLDDGDPPAHSVTKSLFR